MSQRRSRQMIWTLGLSTLAFVVVVSRPWTTGIQKSQANSSGGKTAERSNESGWPQLRGPTFDSLSTETGLANSWPEEGPPVVWTRTTWPGILELCGRGRPGLHAIPDSLSTIGRVS